MLAGRRAQAWRHRPEFRRPRHFHREPELNLVVRGSCLLGVGDRSVGLVAGQAVFLAPGQDHVLLEHSSDFDLFVLALTPELAERVLGARAALPSEGFELDRVELERHAAVLAGLGSVSDAAESERRLGELFASATKRAPRTHVLSRRALQVLRDDPALSEVNLAGSIGGSASRISRLFHRDLGLTLVEHRARVRLMAFVTAVDRGASLTAAAFAAGFGSYAQCHRVFQRALAQSPREYFAGGRRDVDDATFVGAG